MIFIRMKHFRGFSRFFELFYNISITKKTKKARISAILRFSGHPVCVFFVGIFFLKLENANVFFQWLVNKIALWEKMGKNSRMVGWGGKGGSWQEKNIIQEKKFTEPKQSEDDSFCRKWHSKAWISSFFPTFLSSKGF